MVKFNLVPTAPATIMLALVERLPRIASHIKGAFGNLRPKLKDQDLGGLLAGAAGHYTDCQLNSSMFAVYDHESRRIEVASAAGELRGEGGRTEFPQPYPSVLMERVLMDWQSVHVRDLSAEQEVEVELYRDEGRQSESHSRDSVLSVMPRGFTKREGAMLLTPLGIEGTTKLAFGFIQEYNPLSPFYQGLIDDARDLAALFTWQIVEKYAHETGLLTR
jgi:hypothetical protein